MPPRQIGLTLLFALEVLALSLAAYPSCRSFESFLFHDMGANLTVQALLDQGRRPAIDFGYHYGLLPLAVGRLGFGLLGRTPYAYYLAMVALNLLTAWALARFATALRMNAAGIVLLLAAMPISVQPQYPNLAQALEAALLSLALAEQARGRRGAALALATTCCFIKPTMAYVYGFLLLITILAAWRRQRTSTAAQLWHELRPAAAMGILLAPILAACFGVLSLIRTLLPLAGAEAYKNMNFGFWHGLGRDFWNPPGAGPGYYAGTIAGFWLIGTACLWAFGLAALGTWLRTPQDDEAGKRRLSAAEVIASCATMHWCFVMFFFGNQASWMYYSYVLVMGLAAVATIGPRSSWLVAGLVLCALIGQKSWLGGIGKPWRTTAPSGETAGLWASPRTRAEWRELRQRSQHQRISLLIPQCGGAEVMYPDLFAPPQTFFLNRGLALPAEIQRKTAQLSAAPLVLMLRSPFYGFGPDFKTRWPEFAHALEGCEVAWQGDFFRLYRRIRPPGRSSHQSSEDHVLSPLRRLFAFSVGAPQRLAGKRPIPDWLPLPRGEGWGEGCEDCPKSPHPCPLPAGEGTCFPRAPSPLESATGFLPPQPCRERTPLR